MQSSAVTILTDESPAHKDSDAAAAMGAMSPHGRQQQQRRTSRSGTPPCNSWADARARMLEYDRHSARYRGTTYTHILAIINPSSGERAATEAVRTGLCAEIGHARVVVLSSEVFANPSGLRQLVKEYAVMFSPDGGGDRSVGERGTVVVSGGDGTIAFAMQQIQIVTEELQQEFSLLWHPDMDPGTSEQDTADGVDASDCEVTTGSANPHRPFYVMPSLAPIPLGTGNDYSNYVGFGSGFSHYKGGGWCFCCETDVAALLQETVSAPSVRLDRWAVDVVPLRVAQQYLLPVDRQEGDEPQSQTTTERGVSQGSSRSSSQHSTVPRPAGTQFNNDGTNTVDRPLEPNTANTVHHVDWAAIQRDRENASVSRYTFINYLGIGYDAYIVRRFDRARRQYPWWHSTRLRNKVTYGVLGMTTLFKCKASRKMIPMVCVSNPFPTVASSASTTPLSAGRPEMIGLQLPSHCKAVLITNVNRYAGGAQPWDPAAGEVYHRPVHIEGVALRRSLTWHSPIMTPVAVNDGKFELQAMGGAFQFGAICMGMTSATKVSQTGEAFIFVLCTPDDLRGTGNMSKYTATYLQSYEHRIPTDADIRASLSMQIDGEALPALEEPTVLHVHPAGGHHLYVRCRNPNVVRMDGGGLAAR